MNKDIETKVKLVLSQKPETRNSDKLLFIELAEHYGMVLNYYQKSAFLKMPSFESFRRTRQKLQESGLFPADESTKRGRKAKEAKMRVEMKKKEYIPQYDSEGRLQGYLIK